jgi:hypothetical protein
MTTPAATGTRVCSNSSCRRELHVSEMFKKVTRGAHFRWVCKPCAAIYGRRPGTKP